MTFKEDKKTYFKKSLLVLDVLLEELSSKAFYKMNKGDLFFCFNVTLCVALVNSCPYALSLSLSLSLY